jgi:hypothetical protein
VRNNLVQTVFLIRQREMLWPKCGDLCENVGMHGAFNVAGVQAGLNQALEVVRTRRLITNVAVWKRPCTIDASKPETTALQHA